MSDDSLKPFKGADLVLNQEVLDFLSDVLGVLTGSDSDGGVRSAPAYDDATAEETPEKIIQKLLKLGWEESRDSYGHKAYMSTPYPATVHGGEFRIGVVLKNNGVLHLDIRIWGEY